MTWGVVMPPTRINDKLLSWASELDPQTVEQAKRTARLPVVDGHVALMPDAHLGIGATVGSVIPTRDTIIPAAIGVDIGCFTGDTEVILADSRSYTLRELAARSDPFVVYSCTPKGRVVAAWATARLTRRDQAIVAVELDNSETIRCTPDHEFMLRDGSFAAAGELAPGTALMPFDTRLDKEGYFLVRQPETGCNQRAHWIIARAGLLGDIPSVEGQRTVIHHRNFDEADNRPENLKFMGDRDHSALHRGLVERNEYWQSAEFERRRKEALAAKAATPEGHAYFAARGTKNIVAYMRDHPEEFRASVAGNGQRGREFLIAYNTSSAGRAKSKEIANRLYTCEVCGEKVRSGFGIHNHRRWRHGFNHKVASVRRLEDREDVFCLTVPEQGNFGLAAGVFVHNCGMVAVETGLVSSALPDSLDALIPRIERAIPAGMGQAHDRRTDAARTWFADHPPARDLDAKQRERAVTQFGTLGSGNHFACLALDERDDVWAVVHSGSRGIGNQLARRHIDRARKLAETNDLQLEDPDLAYFTQGTPEFDEYVADMQWAQDYAHANRDQMMNVVLQELFDFVGAGSEQQRINCHHNYSARERHDGRELWITRKGAIRARSGDRGVIPGSMGNDIHIVRGLGNAESYESCAHGAGRRHSRRQAKKRFTVEQLRQQMTGVTWNRDRAGALLDEIPDAYKDLAQVMADQADLVEIEHSMKEILNYKGS
jgi:tRNA-splicing ligase RtcB (3'-phosphate/5'-hydroxy nucleic acid ligase)